MRPQFIVHENEAEGLLGPEGPVRVDDNEGLVSKFFKVIGPYSVLGGFCLLSYLSIHHEFFIGHVVSAGFWIFMAACSMMILIMTDAGNHGVGDDAAPNVWQQIFMWIQLIAGVGLGARHSVFVCCYVASTK